MLIFERYREFVQDFHRKFTAAGHLGQVRQKRRTASLFRSRTAIRFKQSDGINLNVGFANKLANFSFRIPAMIISPIRYDEQSFPCVACSRIWLRPR